MFTEILSFFFKNQPNTINNTDVCVISNEQALILMERCKMMDKAMEHLANSLAYINELENHINNLNNEIASLKR